MENQRSSKVVELPPFYYRPFASNFRKNIFLKLAV